MVVVLQNLHQFLGRRCCEPARLRSGEEVAGVCVGVHPKHHGVLDRHRIEDQGSSVDASTASYPAMP